MNYYIAEFSTFYCVDSTGNGHHGAPLTTVFRAASDEHARRIVQSQLEVNQETLRKAGGFGVSYTLEKLLRVDGCTKITPGGEDINVK